jgi:hypothetical protein
VAGYGFNSFNSTKSFEDFCKDIGCDTPLDMDFGAKCVRFFSDKKGKSEEEAKTLCYGVAQKKYKELLKAEDEDDDDKEDDELTEDNKYYKTKRSEEKRRIAKNSMAGYSKTGKKQRKDKGRAVDSFDLGAEPASTFKQCVTRQVDRGYEEDDSVRICAKTRLGIKDRIDSGVGGNITKQLKRYAGDPFRLSSDERIDREDPEELRKILKQSIESFNKDNPEQRIEVDLKQFSDDDVKVFLKYLNRTYKESLDDVFDSENLIFEKKKKKKKKKKSRRGGFLGYGGFGYHYNDSGSDGDSGGDGGGGGE